MAIFNYLFGIVIAISIILSRCHDMLGPGKWSILSIDQCEDADRYPTTVGVDMHRVNRTHVAFSFSVHIDRDIDQLVAVRLDICKYVDGGCKHYQTIADESAIRFFEKYAKQNVAAGFNIAGIDNWPVPAGDYEVNDYVFNMDELPQKAMYDSFISKGYFIKGGVDFTCVHVAIKFEKSDDGDDDE